MLKNEFMWMRIFFKTAIVKILLWFRCFPITNHLAYSIATTNYRMQLRYHYEKIEPSNCSILQAVKNGYITYKKYCNI